MDKVKEDFKNILSQCELLDLDASSLDDSFELEDTIQETADNSDTLYWYCVDLDEDLDAIPDTKKKVQDKLGNLMGLAEGIRDIADLLQNEFDDFPEKVDTFQKKIPDMKLATESLFKELFPKEELLLTKSKADNLKCLKQLNFHSPEVIKKETNKNDFGTPTKYPKQIPTFKTLEKIIMNSNFNENKRNEILWFYMTYFEQKKILDEKDFDNNEIFISKKQKNLFTQMLIILEKYKEDEIFSLYYQILVTEIDRFINLEVKP